MNLKHLYKTIRIGFVVLAVLVTSLRPLQTAQAAGVVGTGTPGSCTEAAFEAALSSGGTISFNCGANPHTIILTSFKVIAADTEIQGGNLITLSGGDTISLFSINATLTLRDITLTQGGHGSFGTIRNFGTLNLIDSQITYGSTASSGGAIENYGEVNINTSVLKNNSADIAAGAILNEYGVVNIESSQINNNISFNNSGAIKNNFGAVYIHNSQIYNNTSQYCSSESNGGGILNNGVMEISQSMITNNHATNGGGIYNAGAIQVDDTTIEGNTTFLACYGNGGGMVNKDQATVTDSQFTGNRGASYGGGLFNDSDSHITITDSVFNQNEALGGGAISNSGTLTLTHSTVYTNTASYGGGIANGIAGGTPNILILNNVTVSENANTTVSGGGGLQADQGTTTVTYATFANNWGEAGIKLFGGELTFKNSIVANNASQNCIGSVTSQGFNISSDYTCSFFQEGDLYNTDALLKPLESNGGPTTTHLPQSDSPAIDGGQCVAGITTDQRRILRPQSATCDIGAVEFHVLDSEWWVALPLLNR